MRRICGALVLFFLPFSLYSAPPVKNQSFLVVIDPGHGGSDLGASFQSNGVKITEKELTLAIAKEAAARLIRKGFRVALTRTRDEDVPLPERTSLANRLGANIFISLHVNSSTEHGPFSAEGIETYILNNSTDVSTKRLTDLENAVLKGSVADAQKNSDLALIVKDLLLDSNLSASKKLACMIQNQLVHHTSTQSTRYRDRGVKQGLFFVLLGADMPSVLVEMGFITNPRDRQITTSEWGQTRLGNAIAQGVEDFKNHRTLSKCKTLEQFLPPSKPKHFPTQAKIPK